MKNNNDIKYILSVQIYKDRTQRTLTLFQNNKLYIFDILNIFNMPHNNPLKASIYYTCK